LRRELNAVFVSTWHAVRQRGLLAMDIALIVAIGTIVFWLGYRSGAQHAFRAVSAVRETNRGVTNAVRLPGSILAPYPGVPFWWMVILIMVSFTIGEVHLGRLRLIVVGVIGQVLATLAGWALTGTAAGKLIGLGANSSDLDTGPSVISVSVLAAVFVVLDCPILLGILAIGLVGEVVVQHSLTGVEHVAALIIGVIAGVVMRLGGWSGEVAAAPSTGSEQRS